VTAKCPRCGGRKPSLAPGRASRGEPDNARSVRRVSVMLMTLITLFVLFVATWIALFLQADQHPITALAEAASQVPLATCRIA